jgi:hypothetical protein
MGRLGPVDGDEAMAANILAVWNGDITRMSKAATVHAHQFSWDRSMESLLGRIYRDLLAGKALRSGRAEPVRSALPQAA